MMVAFKDDDSKSSKRDVLVNEHLIALGIMSIDDAPDELIEEANEEADKVLGKGNDN
jgi:Mg/Co/Ni transporter MgtE